MATPFHRPSPWCASSYPTSRKASAGASGSASLVSYISSTSGRARSSHHVTFSRRAFSDLTFQVAILTSPSYEEPARSASPSWSLRGKGFSAICPASNLRGSLPGSMGREAHPEAKTFWPVDVGDRRDPGCGGRRGGIRDFRDHAAQAPTQGYGRGPRPERTSRADRARGQGARRAFQTARQRPRDHLGLPTEPPTPLPARAPPRARDLFPDARLDGSVRHGAAPLPGCPRKPTCGALPGASSPPAPNIFLDTPFVRFVCGAAERGDGSALPGPGWGRQRRITGGSVNLSVYRSYVSEAEGVSDPRWHTLGAIIVSTVSTTDASGGSSDARDSNTDWLDDGGDVGRCDVCAGGGGGRLPQPGSNRGPGRVRPGHVQRGARGRRDRLLPQRRA